ncbi:hypothetical protein DENSPDRAFT_770437, partial [Dentipellis sp. KUC8613]
STHNQRIERLWGDVGAQFFRYWRAFFLRLEHLHGLDPGNPHHLWLLHSLFLGEINLDCETFRAHWNQHAVSGTHDQTPEDMRFLSAVEHGVYNDYRDELSGVHPDLLQRYYGTEGNVHVRSHGQTGAGHSSDEGADHSEPGDEAELDPIPISELEDAVAADQEPNIRHDPIPVADHRNPFPNPELQQLFWDAYDEVCNNGILPQDMMLLDSEWDEGGYPSTGEIPYGSRGTRRLVIPLPRELWYPRAVAWCRAIRLLEQVVFDFDML